MTKPKVFPLSYDTLCSVVDERIKKKNDNIRRIDEILSPIFDKLFSSADEDDLTNLIRGFDTVLKFRCDTLHVTKEMLEGYLERNIPYLKVRSR